MKNIVIIGAGAAGLMTAATILESRDLLEKGGAEGRGGGLAVFETEGNQSSVSPTESHPFRGGAFRIHLFDKNPIPGTKVALAGGGRCNLTTGIEDKKLLLSKYTRGSEFIKKALGKFSPRKCREWFESHDLPLKLEADNRVFPASDDGRDVVEVFENIFAKHQGRITLHYGEPVVSVIARNEAIQKQNNDSSQGQERQKFLVTTSKGTYESEILVIASGGNAYAHTGSSGDGYTFARNLGHTITELGPSLSSFLTKEKWTHELSGLVFESAKISFLLSSGGTKDLLENKADFSQVQNNKNNLQLSGPLLLTHFGISGPLAFQLSSHLAWEDIGSKPPGERGKSALADRGIGVSENQSSVTSKTGQLLSQGAYRIIFSPISEMDFALWNSFLLEQFGLHPKKLIMSILVEKLPRRFAEGFVEEYFPHIRETFAASISRDDREKLAKLLGEGIPLTLLDRRPGDEFVTAGGVDTLEVNPETMESRIQKNLYFAGEVLNVDAVTGGFNLQACWAGGYSAGKDIVEKLSQTS